MAGVYNLIEPGYHFIDFISLVFDLVYFHNRSIFVMLCLLSNYENGGLPKLLFKFLNSQYFGSSIDFYF